MKSRIFVDSIEALEHTYHELIPISRALGIRVLAYPGDRLTITAPLSNNINHQLSAFGGSLFSVAVLAGWGLMQLKLSELDLDCNTVIAGGEVSYQKPVYSDLTCTCQLPPDFDSVIQRATETGSARTAMTSTFYCEDTDSEQQIAMQFDGRYHLRRRS